MAHWVSWKCGLGMRAAREHVRVAVALRDLPEARAAFAGGELSFSKVRALTRFTIAEQERSDVELARQTTAAQLERIAGAYVAACRAAEPDPERRALDASFVATAGNADGVTGTITMSVPIDLLARFDDAMDAAMASIPSDDAVPAAHRRVLAFAAIVEAFCEPDPTRPAVETIVHADVETLADDVPGRCEASGRRIASETARRLACDSAVQLAVDRGVSALDLGRRARFPNPALRRFVVERNHGCCQFPGCTQRTRLRVHHVQHWAQGGATDRENLVPLGPAHHRAVHEGGWDVLADERTGFTFVDPRGRPVPAVELAPPTDPGAVIAGASAVGVEITDRTIESLAGGARMDLDWTMTVVCGNRGVDPVRVRRCSAERSGDPSHADEWTVVIPPPDGDDEDPV